MGTHCTTGSRRIFDGNLDFIRMEMPGDGVVSNHECTGRRQKSCFVSCRTVTEELMELCNFQFRGERLLLLWVVNNVINGQGSLGITLALQALIACSKLLLMAKAEPVLLTEAMLA